MRKQFDKQLDEVNTKLLEMASLIESGITQAIHALKTQDAELAKEVMENDELIDSKEKEIESLCLRILIQQQPVAGDLRVVSTALKLITDMERIGDHAADISEITEYLSDKPYIKNLEHIPLMADAAIKMVSDSIDAYVRLDLDLANKVIADDDVVDDLFFEIKSELIDLVHKDVKNGEQAFDFLMVAKYLERIGDHSVNIAEWVVFCITGVYRDTKIL